MAAGSTTPCKVTSVGLENLNVKAADMPLNCLLSTSDNKTQILTVTVTQASDGSVVTGQPVNLTGTSFSLNLPVGSYSIRTVVGFEDGAAGVRIVESCAGQTELNFINVPVTDTGAFALDVVA